MCKLKVEKRKYLCPYSVQANWLWPSFDSPYGRALYEHITGRLVDKFTTICSTRSKRHLCSNFEEFLDCGFRAMEKYAADGKCKMPEGLNKR
ncbi:hypothetical protein TNCV_3601081 [Trichonephila clavipes]|nr:hypothetical protein TNCV_3601081 [Trichonephila clavipes]